MQLDPTTTEGAAYIADHLGATYDETRLADFLDGLHHCDECGDVFTEASDTGYGENKSRVCRTCCVEANEDRAFARLGR